MSSMVRNGTKKREGLGAVAELSVYSFMCVHWVSAMCSTLYYNSMTQRTDVNNGGS